jgi:hypothetical protein
MFMRAGLIGALSVMALSSGAVLCAGAPIPNDAQTALNFLLATCQDSADNLAAVAQLAKQRDWTSMLDPTVPEKGPLKVEGIWLVRQSGQSYTVSIGIGPRGKTTCEVGFISPKPRRDDFMAAAANAATLTNVIDQASPSFRLEMYRIENLAPKNVVLQLASSPDGAVFEASVIGPP